MKPLAAAMLLLAPAMGQNVDTIVARNLEAHGGLAAIHSAASRRITARLSSDSVDPGSVLIEQRRAPDGPRFRIEVARDGVTLVRAFDGARGWAQVIPASGRAMPAFRLAGDEASNLAEDAGFDSPLVDWRQRGIRVRYDGRVPLNGRDAFKLMVRLNDGNVFYYFLDPDTMLEARTVGGRDTGGREVLVESDFADYRATGGQKVAFRIDSDVPETGRRQTLTIQRIEWNQVIPESRFRFPADSSGPLGAIPFPRAGLHAAD